MGSPCGIKEERLHNRVVDAFSKTFGSEFEIHLNLGDEKNYDLKGYYPDIIAINKSSGDIHIAEVKTPTLINRKVAEEQWKPFSNLGKKFILIIPEDKADFVQLLLRKVQGINVDSIILFKGNEEIKFEQA